MDEGKKQGLPHYATLEVKYTLDLSGDKINSPCGVITCQTTKHVVVSDWGYDRILFLSSELKLLTAVGIQGIGKNQFSYPEGVAINKLGQVFVADTENNRIQIMDMNGEHIDMFTSRSPRGLAFDEDNRLFVCSRYRILIYAANGQLLSTFGSFGEAPGQFQSKLCFICTSKTHNKTIISDTDGNLHIFTHSGDFIEKIPACQEPLNLRASGVAVDYLGNILVADRQNGHILVLDSNLEVVSKIGHEGYFKEIRGIAVTKDCEVIVCDQERQSIQVFGVSCKT